MTPRLLCASLCITAVVTALALLLGVPLARLLARLPRAVVRLIEILLILALLPVPTLLGIVIYRAILQNAQPWNLLHRLLPWMSSITLASAIGALAVSFPILLLLAIAAFRSVDKETVLAARTLGMRRSAIVWNVILPQARPGIVAGVVLCGARALGESTATAVTLAGSAAREGDLLQVLDAGIRSGGYLLIVLWIAGWLLIAGLVLLILRACSRRRGARSTRIR